MTAPRRLAAQLAAATLALLLPAVAAAAEQVTVDDGRGDMVRVDEGGGNSQPAPAARVGDVVRTTFRHEAARVVVRTRFVALERAGRRFTVWVDVRADSGQTWHVGVQATRRDRGGRLILIDGRGRDVACSGGHRIDYAHAIVRVAIPRRCLGDPDRLRFRLLTEHVRRDWAHAWLDNGLAASMDDRGWTAWLAAG